MNEPLSEAPQVISEEWKVSLFADAQTDLRWYKERSSSSVQWSLAVFAGMAVAAIGDGLEYILAGIATLQAMYAVTTLRKLHDFGSETRNRVRRVLPPEAMPNLYPNLPKRDPHHHFHLGFDILLILLGYAAIMWFLLWT